MQSIQLWDANALGPLYAYNASTREIQCTEVSAGEPLDGYSPIRKLHPISTLVDQEGIGRFELTMTLSIDKDGEWQDIVPDRLISVMMPITPEGYDNVMANRHALPFNETIKRQFFRIVRIEHNAGTRMLTITANHASYDAANTIIGDGFGSNDYMFMVQLRNTTPNNDAAFEDVDGAGALAGSCMPTGKLPVILDDTQPLPGKSPSQLSALTVLYWDKGDRGFTNLQRLIFDKGGLLDCRLRDEVTFGHGSVRIYDREKDQYYIQFIGHDSRDLRFMAVRDNHTIKIRLFDTKGEDDVIGYRSGVTVLYGRNMAGMVWTIDASEVVNAIVPIVRNETTETAPADQSRTAYFQGTNIYYSDSHEVMAIKPNKNYGLTFGRSYMQRDGSSPKQSSAQGPNASANWWSDDSIIYSRDALLEGSTTKVKAPLRLRQLDVEGADRGSDVFIDGEVMVNAARNEFRNGADKPRVTVEVDMQMLGDTAEYRELRNIEAVWLWSQVRVVYPPLGYDELLTVTSMQWDVLTQRYTRLTLGDPYDPPEMKISW